MGWQDLLSEGGTSRTLPWLGGRQVHSHDRTWHIKGKLPKEFGWYDFETKGSRECTLKGPSDLDEGYLNGHPVVRGILVGDRIIPDNARVDPDPKRLIEQTEPVFCVPPGMDRFERVTTVRDRENRLVFIRMEWPEASMMSVQEAYQDRKDSLEGVKDVVPSMDLAFRWMSFQRLEAEARQAEIERLQAEAEAKFAKEEQLRRLMKQTGTAEGRRALAVKDFQKAAKAALQVSGAELLDVIATHKAKEVRVQYRFRNRRLECVVNRETLGVLDAGVCLDDHRGTKGDTWFTLESLPGVIGEALDRHKLVVWRHVPGDVDYDDDDDDDY